MSADLEHNKAGQSLTVWRVTESIISSLEIVLDMAGTDFLNSRGQVSSAKPETLCSTAATHKLKG